MSVSSTCYVYSAELIQYICLLTVLYIELPFSLMLHVLLCA